LACSVFAVQRAPDSPEQPPVNKKLVIYLVCEPETPELAEAAVDQISLESAQQGVDLAILDAVPGKRFIVGVIDLADDSPVEDVETVERRIRAALRHVSPDRLLLAPDCGMKYLPRQKAFEKLKVMVEAAALVRASL